MWFIQCPAGWLFGTLFSTCLESYSKLTFRFLRGVAQPPTSQSYLVPRSRLPRPQPKIVRTSATQPASEPSWRARTCRMARFRSAEQVGKERMVATLVGGLEHFLFSHIGNNHPNWLSYFSEGFKPPTRTVLRYTQGKSILRHDLDDLHLFRIIFRSRKHIKK